ncbi:hypothetical protein [Methylotuvimicrobium sp. KM1]|uniref:hypothetical protein n=1 Tax=Methylotuvimicrobium sp. KM1 TaxID=3377707 RepID=UPI00384E82A5
MSSEDNNNQASESTQETIEKETASKSSEDKAESIKKMAGGFLSSALKLKDEKPKIFYGAVGGVVVLLGIMMFGGGSGSSVSGPVMKNLVIGQKYVLQGPNAYDKNSTIRLVAVPGTIAAYDDTEEDDRVGGCKHMAPGTPVTILGFQDAFGKKNAFVNIKIEAEGECQGKTAWTNSINVQ